MTLVSSGSHAQFEILLSKNANIRKTELDKFQKNLESINNESIRFDKIKKLKDFAKKHNNVSLELEADFIEINYMIFLNTKSIKFKPEEILKKSDVILKEATENNLQDIKLRILLRKGNYYWSYLGNYELGFETYFLMDKELEKVTSEEFQDKAFYINTIGGAFYFFQDYLKASEYFRKSEEIKINFINSSDLISMKNNLGLCYQKLNRLEESKKCFEEVIASKKSYRNYELWSYIAKGNLGYTYFLEKRYDKAIPLFQESIKGTLKTKEYVNACGYLTTLADIYLKKGQIKEAGTCLKKARELINKIDKEDKKHCLRNFYPIISKWYQKSGEKDLAIQYLDSTIIAKELYNKEYSVLQLLRAQQKNDIQKHRLTTFNLINEQQKKTNQRNIILVILVSIMFGLSGVYYFQRKRSRRELQIKDLKLTISSKDLQMATLQLQDFTDKLQEKNRIIEILQKQNDVEEDNEIVQQIKIQTILTNDDWDKFQDLFEKVHSGFLYRLKNKHKELTASEIRYITLAKLHLSQKEMANILGISPNSVRVTWHRVSKKLHLSDKNTLEDFLLKL